MLIEAKDLITQKIYLMTRFAPMYPVFCCLFLGFVHSCTRPSQTPPAESREEKAKHAPVDHFFLQRSYPESTFAEQAYLDALEEVRAQMNLRLSPPVGFSEAWSAKGPGNIGARVNALAVHPNNEQIIYAGFSGGGLFKTTDGGLNWQAIFEDRPYLAIGAIAIDPQNPEIVYVGTGDPNITGYPFLGDGLYRSNNGGQSWTRIGLEDTRIISKIVIDPSNTQRIYVGTMGLPFVRNRQRGLYRSSDGGRTWQQSLFVSEQAGIIDLVMDPRRPNVLYAAGWNRIRNNRESIITGTETGVYKSVDNGQNWVKLSGGLPTGRLGRIGLAFYAGEPDLVFAVVVDENSQLQNIYRSADAGNSWEALIGSGKSNLQFSVLGNLGWYFGKIAVNPKNPAELFLLSISLWKTSDGGRTWSAIGERELHSDKHALVFTPSGKIIVGSDGGIDRSADGGSNWEDIENIPTTQFYRIDYNPHQPNVYYGGAQDHGTVSGGGLNGTWQRIEGGDGFQMRFHPSNPQIVWAQTQNGTLRVSTNGGSFFQLALVGIDRNERVNWDAPLLLSKHNPDVLYTGTMRVYQNKTGAAASWKPISEDLTDGEIFGRSFHTVSTLHESPLLADYLVAGTSDGNVWLSTNQGGNWARIDAGLPERYVTAVRFSPSNSNALYVSHSGYKDNENQPLLHLSRNRGQSWTSIAGNLPPLAINDFIVLPGYQDRVLFVATDGGVYASVDAGQNWYRLGTNLPIIAAYSLAWNVARNELVVGTFGKSIYAYPLRNLLNNLTTTAPLVNLDPALLKVYPLPFHDELNLHWQAPDPNASWKLKIFDTRGSIIYTQTLGKGDVENLRLPTAQWTSGAYWLQVEDGRRQVRKKLLKQ